MCVSVLIPVLLYLLCVQGTRWLAANAEEFRRVFAALAFSILPLAFSYHIAHNLTHLVREGRGFWGVVANPLGTGLPPLSMHELHLRHMYPLLADHIVFAVQGLLVLFGFWLALRVARQRLPQHTGEGALRVRAYLPIFFFISLISLVNLWLLMQPMVMRM